MDRKLQALQIHLVPEELAEATPLESIFVSGVDKALFDRRLSSFVGGAELDGTVRSEKNGTMASTSLLKLNDDFHEISLYSPSLTSRFSPSIETYIPPLQL